MPDITLLRLLWIAHNSFPIPSWNWFVTIKSSRKLGAYGSRPNFNYMGAWDQEDCGWA
jgi:hypothetical protein